MYSFHTFHISCGNGYIFLCYENAVLLVRYVNVDYFNETVTDTFWRENGSLSPNPIRLYNRGKPNKAE